MHACLPGLSPLGFLLIAFAFWVSVRLYRTGCLPFCVPPALGGFCPQRPALASDLPPSLCLMPGIRSEASPSHVYLVCTWSPHVAIEIHGAPIVFGDHDSLDAVGLCLLACPATTRLRSA